MKAKIQLFQDTNKCWRWRITASNGEILATSEAYSSRRNATDTAKMLAEATRLAIVKP